MRCTYSAAKRGCLAVDPVTHMGPMLQDNADVSGRTGMSCWAPCWRSNGSEAADYPTRPVSLVVAFTPGGASDVLARLLGRKLEQILGQPFVIDNRPGAGGNVAAEAVAHAAPDGYTLLLGNNAILATNAALYKKVNFDAGGGLRADRPDRIAGQYPGGESGGAGEIDGRADRARQGQSGQAQFRLVGPRRWRRISPASCSRPRPRSTSCTCPTRAPRRPCRT